MDFTLYLSDSANIPSYWRQYTFPNGHSASVILDPRRDAQFRFEVESTDPDDIGTGSILPNLSTDEVEAKLARLFALEQNEDAD